MEYEQPDQQQVASYAKDSEVVGAFSVNIRGSSGGEAEGLTIAPMPPWSPRLLERIPSQQQQQFHSSAMEDDSVSDLEAGLNSTINTALPQNDRSLDMPQAIAVESARNLAQAEEVLEDDAMDRKINRSKQQIRMILLVLFIGVLLVVGAILGAVLGTKDSTSTVIKPRQPSPPSASSNVSSNASVSETALDSELLLIDDLPNYTLQSLLNPLSPQYKALFWLSKRKDIDSMEQWKRKQLFALVTLYYAFGGEFWGSELRNDWLDETRSECGWFSSIYNLNVGGSIQSYENPYDDPVCDDQGRFQIISIQDMPLSFVPAMPPEIALLESLTEIWLPRNGFAAPVSSLIPSQLGTLSNLTAVHLHENSLYDQLPTELGLLKQLKELNLHKNSIVGPLPSEIGLVTKLTSLELRQNLISGSLPLEISDLENLEWFYVSNNNITGELPYASLLQMTSLKWVSLGGNAIRGTIQSELGLMSQLEYLELDENLLSGTLPTFLGLLSKLKVLDLSSNSISGALPAVAPHLTSMTSLLVLDLSSNRIQGPLATELGLMTNLRGIGTSRIGLDLSSNSITGTLPTELGLLATSLNFLDLSQNRLQGTIPTEFGYFEGMNLSFNELSGPIPSELGSFNLTFPISLLGNFWSGNLPPELCASCYPIDEEDNTTIPAASFLEVDCTLVNCECNCSNSNQYSNARAREDFAGDGILE
jgi:Leucine-rich repeat (LRR) protein